MSVRESIEAREIAELLHFTTNEGLVGMLATGCILSRERLGQEKYLEHIFKPNARFRKDHDWLDYVNLSISRINDEFFDHSFRWHESREIWWCVVSLDPGLLDDQGVVFTTTNNIYTGVQRASGPKGLEALFGDRVERWAQEEIERPDDLPRNCPTCCQAEVLYPKMVPVTAFRKVYVSTPEQADVVGGQLSTLGPRAGLNPEDIPIVVRPEIFE
jgi:hypothetical protein